jgi:uncharacterized Zn finger protein (UPF0148 family)
MERNPDYTTCAECGSPDSMKAWGKVIRCKVCHGISEPAPNREQIEEAKRVMRKRRETTRERLWNGRRNDSLNT